MPKRSCTDCAFAVFIDYGFSNYTVEGTTFKCANKRHPEGEFDRGWGEDKRLNYAAECEAFAKGDPINMDAEREGKSGLTLTQHIIWQKVEGDA